MKILFFGSSGLLSLIPLVTLLKSCHTVCAIVTNETSDNEFNVVTTGTIQSLAFNNSIPIIYLNKNIVTVLDQISQYQPDVIITSCYPHKVPDSILSIAKIGAYNLHPSLLPLFRGPTPLFWQFREGISDFGITLHRMNAEFDQGNIVAQKTVKMSDGVSIYDATSLIADVGSQLILKFLNDLNKNKINEQVQDESISSYQSFPTINDYRVSPSWAARRIYNFINAYNERGVFFLCEIERREFKLIDALSYQHTAFAEMDNKSYLVTGDEIFFACGSGFVRCKLNLDELA